MSIVILRNTEKTTIAIEYDFRGKAILEPGVVPVVTVDAVDKLTATLRADEVTIDVVTVDDAAGGATVTVTATFTDGVVLVQTQEFMVVAPEADAITLLVADPTDKLAPIAVPPVVNVVAAPQQKAAVAGP